MNFATGDDLRALVDSVAEFFERRGDAEAIAQASTTSVLPDRQRWTALCDLGVPVFRVPEPDGIGARLLDATALAEQTGAVLLPEPAVGTMILANAWRSHPSADEMLAALCSGSRIVTLGGLDVAAFSPSGGVSGRVRVPFDTVTDAVALLANDQYTAGRALVILDRSELPSGGVDVGTDPTRPTSVIEFEGVEPTDVLRLNDGAADELRREIAVLACAELVGGMQRVLTDTVAFVKSREQFGRSIGSFQAIKHRLADMYALTEQARALTQFAAAGNGTETASLVSSAARWIPRSAINLFEDAVHLHGAMGFSWEVSVHLHLRRALDVRDGLNALETSLAVHHSAAKEAV
ncbi:acyl-CoA dehydrogenase family protein [Mycolicibacterium stellerae]|uniref:acyl-CoA dehydrogenase family protein n=1 Tax=Mycolicibacterium stellerae TaxID=2358193 RepID=UPI001F17736E|nr:acyl-CoA dehydrogenase family protein [Mycolicibacterium stellerae]